MEKKYYTVAEFAKKAGISKQAVYQSLEKKLYKYVKEIDGKKYISRDAFSVFNSKLIDSTLEKILIQLEEKDGQIALLLEQIKFQDEEIKRRSEEIFELTKAFREAQALHAGTMKRELTDNSNTKSWWKFWQNSK